MNDAVLAISRGKTQYGPSATIPATYHTDEVLLEGAERIFVHTKYDNVSHMLSNRKVFGRLMRNASGGTLHRGRMVVSASGYEEKRISGYCGSVAGRIAGVIDSHLNATSGVRDGDLCWVMYGGPEYCVFAGGVSVSIGDPVYSNASGKFLPWDYTSSTTDLAGGTTAKMILNTFGIAEETAESGDSDTLKLVDLKLR